MPRYLRLVGWGLLVLACRPSSNDRAGAAAPTARQGNAAPGSQAPESIPPANVSHGEAPIGGPGATPAPIEARLPPRERTRLHRIRLEMNTHRDTSRPGVTYAAWTFGGTRPGARASRAPGRHGGLHPGEPREYSAQHGLPRRRIAPSKYYVNVMPGDSLHYRFVARVPGAFMYHCGTAPVAMHIANGMYGALVVDPATPRPKAKEFVLVQSEFYFAPKPGADGAHTPGLG